MSPAPASRADITVDDLVRATIARAVDQLERNRPDLGTADPEPVHQFRVATRRLRSDLQTFAPFLDPAETRARRDELRWLGGEVGWVRDGDVLAARLQAAADALPATDAVAAGELIDRLRADTALARREVAQLVTGPRTTALLTTLRADRDAPPYRPGREVDARSTAAAAEAAHLVGPPWRRLHRAVRALPPTPTDAELHHVRIRAKRVRYAAEALQPVIGRPARRFARRVADLQDVLGDHQDTVVAEAWLRAAVAAALGSTDRAGAVSPDLRSALNADGHEHEHEHGPTQLPEQHEERLRREGQGQEHGRHDPDQGCDHEKDLGANDDHERGQDRRREVDPEPRADDRAPARPPLLEPATLLAAGELIGAERAIRAERRDAWPEAWARASRPKLRAWFA